MAAHMSPWVLNRLRLCLRLFHISFPKLCESDTTSRCSLCVCVCVWSSLLIQMSQMIFHLPLLVTNRPAGADTHRSLCATDVLGIWEENGQQVVQKDVLGWSYTLFELYVGRFAQQLHHQMCSVVYLALRSKKETAFSIQKNIWHEER